MGKEKADRYKRKINVAGTVFLLFCLAFFITACGDTPVNTAEKADTEPDTGMEDVIMEQKESENIYMRSSTVGDVINDPYFEDFGRLLFPIGRSVSEDMTLEEISSGSVYVWYNYIDPDKTVEIIQSLHDHAAAGDQIFYDIYSEEEKEADPSKKDTGLFFFRGNPGEKSVPAMALQTGEPCSPDYRVLGHWVFPRNFMLMKVCLMDLVLEPVQLRRGGSMMRLHSGKHSAGKLVFKTVKCCL